MLGWLHFLRIFACCGLSGIHCSKAAIPFEYGVVEAANFVEIVEDYVGFERKESEYGGAWAMATFIEASETSDQQKRREVIDKIVAYNREDLEATWAMSQWDKVPTNDSASEQAG